MVGITAKALEKADHKRSKSKYKVRILRHMVEKCGNQSTSLTIGSVAKNIKQLTMACDLIAPKAGSR
jgi:hypothetical protein